MATPEKFAEQYGPIAIDVGRRLRIDPTILLGQWGLETGWGRSVVPGTNNLGNIKDFRRGQGVAAVDNMTGSNDNYRIFESPQAFAEHFTSLIERKYPNAIGTGGDAEAFASALKEGGYAEDPDYVRKIASVANTARRPSVLERLVNFITPEAQAGTLPQDDTAIMTTPARNNRERGRPAKRWSEVVESEAYQRLTPEKQAQAQVQYFNEVVAPKAGDKVEQAKSQFFRQYPPAATNELTTEDGRAWLPLNQQNTHDPSPSDIAAAQARLADQGDVGSGLLMGLRDIPDAAAQMLRRGVPEPIAQRIDQFGNYLADMGLPVARSEGVEGVDAIVNQVNEQYQQGRKAAGREGFDWARLGGGLLGAAPMAAVTPMAAGASLPTRALVGGATGAGFGTLNPVIGEENQANFDNAKLEQALLGGVVGAAAPVVMSGVARAVSPSASRNPQVRQLSSEGVQLTPGQAAGGRMLEVEDRLMSIPWLGDVIRSRRIEGQESLNRAVYNRVLAPLGAKTNKLGRAAVKETHEIIENAYDDVLSKVRFNPRGRFAQELEGIRRIAQNADTPEETATILRILDRETARLFKGNWVDGKAFKDAETAIGQAVKRYRNSSSPADQNIADALQTVHLSLRDSLSRVAPEVGPQLQRVNTAYSRLTVLDNAASRIGADDGVFSASQLASAVRQGDRTIRHNRYAQGQAQMQDLSDAARSVMNQRIPDSGTAGRGITAALAGGGIGLAPGIALPALGAAGLGAMMYTQPMQRVIFSAMVNRPQGAQAVAEGIRRIPASGLLGIAAQ